MTKSYLPSYRRCFLGKCRRSYNSLCFGQEKQSAVSSKPEPLTMRPAAIYCLGFNHMLLYLQRSCQGLRSSFCMSAGLNGGTFVFCSLFSGLRDNPIFTRHATNREILITLSPVLWDVIRLCVHPSFYTQGDSTQSHLPPAVRQPHAVYRLEKTVAVDQTHFR